MKFVEEYSLKVLVILSLSFLMGCTAQLAPRYDAALFDGLTDVNVKIMELFASVSNGTDSSTCSTRVASYNETIGTVDALAIQSEARPIPDNSIIKRVNEYLESRGVALLTGEFAPSAASLKEVSSQLTRMKRQDCASGLTEPIILLHRNAVIISMDQAITYESFLNR